MYRLTSLLAIAAIAGASPTQEVLQVSSKSQVVIDSKPVITTEALQKDITAAALQKRAEKLYEIAGQSFDEYNHPTRVIGSEGHIGTVDYIYSTLAELGDYYELSNQTFPAITGSVLEQKLLIGDKQPESALAMGLTPSTKNGKAAVFGPLVQVANAGCEVTDYPSEVKGAIAFIERGICAFGDKSALAGKAGALAAVIYNNVNGSFGGTLGAPSKDTVGTFGISLEDATPYLHALKKGESVDASAYIDSNVREIGTTNIVAQTKGGDQENCVMLGGHSDSVAAGPGINDDGTGTITLLEVASQLVKYKVNNCVRFAWWAGEEEGLLGSDYYVSQLSVDENLKIRMFMDYDMLASPNYAYQVYNANNKANPVGSQELRDLYTDFYAKNGQNSTYIRFDGRSDYAAFIANGIPGGGIATGAEGVKTKEEVEMFGGEAGEWYDHCYHQLCDDLTNLNYEAWELNAKLVAHSVATYAASLDGFPTRKVAEVQAQGQWVAPKREVRNSRLEVVEDM